MERKNGWAGVHCSPQNSTASAETRRDKPKSKYLQVSLSLKTPGDRKMSKVVWVCLWDAVWPSEKTSDHVPFLKLLLYEDSSPNYSFSYCFFVVSCFLSIVIFFSKLKKQTEVAYFFLPFSFALNVNDERLFCMLITSASSCQGYLPVASLSYFNLGFPRSCKFPAYQRFR